MIIGISGRIGIGKDLIGEIIQYLTSNYYLSKKSFEYFHEQNKKRNDYSLYLDWQIKKFADSLKDIVCILIGCTREQLEDREFKEKELGEEWWYWYMEREGGYSSIILDYLTTTKKELKSYEELALIKPTPRFLMQYVGTNLFRNQLHPEIWVNSLMSEYKENTGYKYSVSLVDKTNKELDSELQPGIEGISFKIKLEENPKLFNNGFPNWIITDVRFPNEAEAIKEKGGIIIRVNRDLVIGGSDYGYTKVSINQAEKDGIIEPQHESEIALDDYKFDYIIDNNSSIEDLIVKTKGILIKENII